MNKKFDTREPSNFWNCCPLKLQYLPNSECLEGTPVLSGSNKLKNAPKCQWWINSKKYNYCFWKYVKDKSNEYGEMPELAQSDLAKLFSWSNTKAHFILKEAIDQLYEVLNSENLGEELTNISYEESDKLNFDHLFSKIED